MECKIFWKLKKVQGIILEVQEAIASTLGSSSAGPLCLYLLKMYKKGSNLSIGLLYPKKEQQLANTIRK